LVAPAPPALVVERTDRGRPRGGTGPRVGRFGAGLLRGGGGGAGVGGASQRRGGVHEQRLADAAVTAQADDAGDAGPEAAVLEQPRPGSRPEEGRVSVPAPGPASDEF